MISWLKSLLIRVSARFHGWLTSEPLRRSLSAAATPPGGEIDPCQDPFGDNLNAKTLAFNAALADLKWAVEAYMNCRQQHGLANASTEYIASQFASIENTRDDIINSIAG